MTSQTITVTTTVRAPLEKVWRYFTEASHIMLWNNASPDWHTPKAENNPVTGGTFDYRMEANDGSIGFNFTGTYDEVVPQKLIRYTMPDGRKVEITFAEHDSGIQITETFDAETVNPIEMQKGGWQAILDNFKQHTEEV